MEFNLDEFVSAPTLEVLHQCRKDDLLLVAEHYKIGVSKQARKATVKTQICDALVERCIFTPIHTKPKSPRRSSSSSTADEAVRLKELEVELKHLALKEKELHYINILETQKLEQQTQIRMRELELGVGLQSKSSDFDVSRNIRLVPPFNEKDVDKYFTMFERVALSLKWPKRCGHCYCSVFWWGVRRKHMPRCQQRTVLILIKLKLLSFKLFSLSLKHTGKSFVN